MSPNLSIEKRFLALPDGASLHYVEHGQRCASKPSILMLHSLFFDASMFLPVIQSLQETWHIICPDHRTQGTSSSGKQPPTMRQLADDCIFLINHLGLDSIHIVGSSMGGYVAQELMQQSPAIIKSAVLSCCTAEAEQQKQRFDELENRLRNNGGAPYVETLLQTMFGDTFLQSSSPEVRTQRDHWANHFSQLPNQVADAVNGVFSRPDYQAHLPSNTIPHLLISGALDRAKKPADMERMHTLLPDSQHVVFEQSGHTPPVECPAAFAQQLETFWNLIHSRCKD